MEALRWRHKATHLVRALPLHLDVLKHAVPPTDALAAVSRRAPRSSLLPAPAPAKTPAKVHRAGADELARSAEAAAADWRTLAALGCTVAFWAFGKLAGVNRGLTASLECLVRSATLHDLRR